MNSIPWFLKLKLTILCQVGTRGRKMYYDSKFEWLKWKFNKKVILISIRAGVEESWKKFQKLISERGGGSLLGTY